ncbi:hypothetical protein LQW54_010110, partial [Pestalotiopsis sp. IQ-011]
MKIIAFLTTLLATGTTALTLPNSTTFSIVENGTRIERVQIPLDVANEQMQEFNRSSPGSAEPPKSADANCVCQDPPRALDFVDVFKATNMLRDMCTNGGATPEGVILPPLSALSVTSREVRITICSFLNSARCVPEEMEWVLALARREVPDLRRPMGHQEFRR